MKSKRVWLVNKYAMPPQYEPRIQTIKTAHYLQLLGYEVILFGASVMHNMDLNLIEDGSSYMEKDYGDLHFVHINTCSYKGAAGFKRVLSDFQFHYKLVCLAKKFPKPDVIIGVTYPLLTNPLMAYAHKHNIKYITQSLDTWPDDFVNYGLIGENNPITKLLFKQAKHNYEKSDACIFSWCGCFFYMKEKKWDKESGGPVALKKLHYINNGVDLTNFNTWKKQYTIDDEDLKSSKKSIIYLGSIRLVNNVERLIHAAELLKDRNDVQFLIYGDGDDRSSLIKYCEEQQLSNVKFKDKWIDPKYVPFVLSQSYLNILNYMSSDFAKYGISSSKMFQYMAAGKPIVCNINIYNCPITENEIGIAREFDSADKYAQAIVTILNLPEAEYNAMCERAQATAKFYNYSYLTNQMAEVIENL